MLKNTHNEIKLKTTTKFNMKRRKENMCLLFSICTWLRTSFDFLVISEGPFYFEVSTLNN